MTGRDLTPYRQQYAALAKQYADAEQIEGGQFVSVRGGVLTFNEQELPGNELLCVILDSVRENTFYDGVYDADVPTAPTCYAFAVDKDPDMGPHISMAQHPEYFIPQSETCSKCPHNVFGSADVGRGKACKNRRRIAFIPAGYCEPKPRSRDVERFLFDKEADFQSADLAMIKLPVTSVKDYSKYVQMLNMQHGAPPLGAITRMYVEPDPKSQYRVRFDMLELLPEEYLPTILARHEEAKAAIMSGYTPPSQEEQATQPQQQRGRGPVGQLRGLRPSGGIRR